MNSLIPTKKSKLDGSRYMHNNYNCVDDLRRVLLQIVKQLLGPSFSEINDIKDGAIFLQLINMCSKIPVEEKKNQSVFETVSDYLNGLDLQDLSKSINFASCEDGKLEELFKLLIYLLFAFHQNESQKQRKAFNEREASNTPPPSELGNKSPTKINPSSRILQTLSSDDQALIRKAFEMTKQGKFQQLAELLKESSPGSSKGTLQYLSSPNCILRSPTKTIGKSPLLYTLRKKEQVIKALRKERAEDEERISSLLREKEEANKEIKALKKKAHENEIVIEQFREQVSSANEVEELRAKVETLSNEKENNLKKLSELKDFKQENPILQLENESLQRKLRDFEDKCNRIEAKLTNQEDLNKLTTSLKEKIESLESELRKSNLQVIYEKEKVEELAKAIEVYKEQLTDTTISNINMDSSGELVSMVCSPFKCPTAHDMQALEEEVKRLNTELSDLKILTQNELLALQCQKDKLFSEFTQVQDTLEEIRNQNETLRKEKELLDGQMATLSSKFVYVEEKAHQLVVECDKLVAKKSELETKLDDNDKKLESCRFDIVTSKGEFERVDQENEELNVKLNNANLKLEEKESVISENQTKMVSLHLQLQTTNDEICELKNLLNEEKSSNNNLKLLIEELCTKKTNLEVELTKAKSDLEECTEALNENRKRDEEYNKAFIELQSCYDSLKIGFLELEAKYEKIEEEGKLKKLANIAEVDLLNVRIKSLEDVVLENESLVAKLEGDNVALSKNLENCMKNIGLLSNEKDDLLTDIGSWEFRIKELCSIKEQLEKERDDIKTINADRLNFLQALNGQVTQLEDKNCALIEELKIAKKSFEQKEQDLKKEMVKLQSENETLTRKNQEIEELANDRYEKLKNFEEEMTTMEIKIVEEVSLPGRKIDSIKQAISKLVEEKDNACEQYDNALILNQNLIQDLEKLEKKLDLKDNSIKCLEKDIQKRLSELNAAQEKEKDFVEQIENLKRSETTLVAERANLLQEIKKNSERETECSSEINQLKTQLDDCVEKIISLTEENKSFHDKNDILSSTVLDLRENSMQQETIKEEMDKESVELQNRILHLQFEVGRYHISVTRLVNELFNSEDIILNKDTDQQDSMNEILKKLKLVKEEKDSLVIEKNTLNAQIKLLEIELDHVKLQVTQMESERTGNERALQDKISEMNKDTERLKRENQYLVRELEVTKESFVDRDLETITKEKELEAFRVRMAEITKDLEVRREIEGQLLDRVHSLKNEEQTLAASLNKSLQDIENHVEKICSLKLELCEGRVKIDKLEEHLKTKEEEICSLKENIAQSRVKKEVTDPVIQELNIQIESLKSEREEITFLFDVIKLENERKSNEIHSQQINYSAMFDAREKLQTEKVELEKKIHQRNREREELQCCLSDRDEQIVSLENEIRDLMEKFEQKQQVLQTTNTTLKNELENANHRRSSMEYIHNVHEKDYKKLLAKYQAFQAEKASQEAEVIKSKSAIEELNSKLDKKQLELNSLSMRLHQNQLHNDAAIKDIKSSKAVLSEELALVKSVVNDLQMKIGANDKHFANSLSSFKGQIDSLHKEQKELKLERNKLVDDLKASESALSEMKEKLASFETMKSKVFNLQDENASQKLAYDILEKDKNQLYIENFNLLEMNSFLKKNLEDLSARSEKNELELKESFKSLRKEKDALTKELTENCSQKERKLESELKETRKFLTKEKVALLKELEEARKKFENLQESHSFETKNLEVLKARSEGRIFELAQTNKLLIEEKDGLMKDLKESRQIQEIHDTKIKSLNERVSVLQLNLDIKETEHQETQESLTKERDYFQKELQTASEKCVKLQEANSLEVTHLEEKVTNLERNLSKEKSELKETMFKENEAQALKIKHLEERVSTLQRNLEASQTKVHSLKLSQNNLIVQKNQLTEQLENTTVEKTKLAEEKEGLHKEWSQRFDNLSSKNDEVVEDNRKLAQRVVNVKKESQTHKEHILQLGKLLEDSQKNHLNLDKRYKETMGEIFTLKKKCEISEESFDEASKRLAKCKELLEQKTKLCENQKEGINHLKFEVSKQKNKIWELEENESTKALSSQVEEYRRRFSCLPNVELTSELFDYPSLSTRSRKQLDASILSPGNNSSVIRFPCEEEEGHFNDHSKNLSNLKAGICETDLDRDRLLELQRRNTLCAPHQRTAYPVETQAWSSRKDPTKVVNKNNIDYAEKTFAGKSSSTIERRKSPRFSSIAFEIKNDVVSKPKRKQINSELDSETPDKRTRLPSSPAGKKRSWKTPLKEFFSPVTPNKNKKFKVPKSRANNE